MRAFEGASGRELPREPRPPTPAAERELLRAAEGERVRVQRLELARLLREAAAVQGGCLHPHRVLAPQPFRPASVLDWGERARREIELLSLEPPAPSADWRGIDREAAELLGRLEALPTASWPSPVALSRAALALRSDEDGHTSLGFAHLAEGDPRGALCVFSRLLRSAPEPRRRGLVLEGLAAAHLALGRRRLALGAFDQAADDPGSSLVALASALYLALALGDASSGWRAAARLDLLVDPTSPAFLSALVRLRTWIVLSGPGLPKLPVAPSAKLFRLLLRSPRSPAGKVSLTLC